jgi:hypothetical protein
MLSFQSIVLFWAATIGGDTFEIEFTGTLRFSGSDLFSQVLDGSRIDLHVVGFSAIDSFDDVSSLGFDFTFYKASASWMTISESSGWDGRYDLIDSDLNLVRMYTFDLYRSAEGPPFDLFVLSSFRFPFPVAAGPRIFFDVDDITVVYGNVFVGTDGQPDALPMNFDGTVLGSNFSGGPFGYIQSFGQVPFYVDDERIRFVVPELGSFILVASVTTFSMACRWYFRRIFAKG